MMHELVDSLNSTYFHQDTNIQVKLSFSSICCETLLILIKAESIESKMITMKRSEKVQALGKSS